VARSFLMTRRAPLCASTSMGNACGNACGTACARVFPDTENGDDTRNGEKSDDAVHNRRNIICIRRKDDFVLYYKP